MAEARGTCTLYRHKGERRQVERQIWEWKNKAWSPSEKGEHRRFVPHENVGPVLKIIIFFIPRCPDFDCAGTYTGARYTCMVIFKSLPSQISLRLNFDFPVLDTLFPRFVNTPAREIEGKPSLRSINIVICVRVSGVVPMSEVQRVVVPRSLDLMRLGTETSRFSPTRLLGACTRATPIVCCEPLPFLFHGHVHGNAENTM